MDTVRQIERYSLNCPILLSPLDKGTTPATLLSLTKDVSAKGAYICGIAQWRENSELLASVFYEISLLSRQQTESRFLIRFLGRVVRKEERGFALEFTTTDMILPLSMTCAMTAQEVEAVEKLKQCWRL